MSSTNIYSLTRETSYPKDEGDTRISQPPLSATQPTSKWQQEYKESITNIDQLYTILGLDIEQLPKSASAQKQFPLRVPQSFVNRMQRANPKDPLLLQILPSPTENNPTEGYLKDPVGDLQSIKTPGLLQKYNGRALLLATSRCAIHCRYCFRRHFPYSEQNARHDNWEHALQELKRDQSISEVILSGGDPLVLDDSILSNLILKLESIQHIKRLRIHTRLPVVLPNRICNSLLSWINNSRLKVVMVLHINHAQEIDSILREKLSVLKGTHCTLLNQSVLLKGVNNTAADLINLSETLFEAGVLPYYLHLMDKVEGAAHFDVDKNSARNLMRDISKNLPGYLVPKLVSEYPGKSSKSIISY